MINRRYQSTASSVCDTAIDLIGQFRLSRLMNYLIINQNLSGDDSKDLESVQRLTKLPPNREAM